MTVLKAKDLLLLSQLLASLSCVFALFVDIFHSSSWLSIFQLHCCTRGSNVICHHWNLLCILVSSSSWCNLCSLRPSPWITTLWLWATFCECFCYFRGLFSMLGCPLVKLCIVSDQLSVVFFSQKKFLPIQTGRHLRRMTAKVWNVFWDSIIKFTSFLHCF